MDRSALAGSQPSRCTLSDGRRGVSYAPSAHGRAPDLSAQAVARPLLPAKMPDAPESRFSRRRGRIRSLPDRANAVLARTVTGERHGQVQDLGQVENLGGDDGA